MPLENESAVIEQEEQAPSLRESLSEAFDKAEVPDQAAPAATPAPAPSAAPTPASPLGVPGGAPAATGATGATGPATPPAELKAPSQWKPAVREKWNGLPREVQEEILRREGDSMRLVGSVGQKIRLADEVSGHMSEFIPRLQQQGVSPSAFIGDLFTSVKSLASGDPAVKAETVANIVLSYGVDLRVLDQVLTRRLQAGPQDVEARRMMAQAQSIILEQKQGQAHQTALQTERELAAFAGDPKHEFFGDVRELMADLIEAGRANTLSDAYAAAIWAHPDTRKILLQREAETRAASKHNAARAARLASSAIHGAPRTDVGNAPVKQNQTLREALTDAFDQHAAA